MTDHDRCRAVIAALERTIPECEPGETLGQVLSDALDLLRRYGPVGGGAVCLPSCRHYGARGCLMSDLPGSPECRRDREQDDGNTREEVEKGR
jgi:hypothetical protein